MNGHHDPRIEDGSGWGGLVESAAERRERDARESELKRAHLMGKAEAYADAIKECRVPVCRENGSMGGRDCMEVRKAIEILWADAVNNLYPKAKS